MSELPLSYLNASELLTISHKVHNVIPVYLIENDHVLHKMTEQLSEDIKKLDICVCIQNTDQNLTAIEKADLLFSNTFLTLRNYCSVLAMQTSDDEISSAASIIASVICSVDWYLNRRSIASELAGARAIADQMSTFDNSESLIRCNASAWYCNFTDAYSYLESVHLSCIDITVSDSLDGPVLKSTKLSTMHNIERIYSYCTALDNMNSTGNTSIKIRFDELIMKFLSSVRINKNLSIDKTAAGI